MNEFRDLVKALHKAGIEVILDVVFNHTDEGNELGPTQSFRGIDNRDVLSARPEQSGRVRRTTAAPATRSTRIIRCRRSSSSIACGTGCEEMHVDGFRFDEGSILARGEDGAPLVASAGHLADRARRRARRHQADRRSVGRRRPVSGRALSRRPLGRVERPLSRRRSQVRQRRSRPDGRRSRHGSAAAPTSIRRAGSRRRTASTS